MHVKQSAKKTPKEFTCCGISLSLRLNDCNMSQGEKNDQRTNELKLLLLGVVYCTGLLKSEETKPTGNLAVYVFNKQGSVACGRIIHSHNTLACLHAGHHLGHMLLPTKKNWYGPDLAYTMCLHMSHISQRMTALWWHRSGLQKVAHTWDQFTYLLDIHLAMTPISQKYQLDAGLGSNCFL